MGETIKNVFDINDLSMYMIYDKMFIVSFDSYN